MTVELFRSDPYRTQFSAQVVDRHRDWIIVDQTCFCPSPGELALHDTGTIEHHRVTAVEQQAGRIVHWLDSRPGRPRPEVGSVVAGRIDWAGRYRNMRAHTVQHLAELAVRATHEVEQVELARTANGLALDIVHGALTLRPRVITEWLNSIIAADHLFLASDGVGSSTHLWHLDGLGHGRCDGLHVRSTGEIGSVDVWIAGRRGTRIELVLRVADAGAEVRDEGCERSPNSWNRRLGDP